MSKERKDLLKEAIADAKAVRETALANAKIALEEAFTPKLQSMLSAKLQNEMEGDEDETKEEMPDVNAEVTEEGEESKDPAALENDPSDPDKEVTEGEETLPGEDEKKDDEVVEGSGEDMPAMETAEEKDENDLDLESVLKELDAEDEEEKEEVPVEETASATTTAPVVTETEEEPKEGEEELSIEEIVKSLKEEDDEEEKEGNAEELEEVKAELTEAYDVIKTLRGSLNEVNLLNAKLLYSNKVFRSYDLNESQKLKVIENFDRAKTMREVKLVFATLSESFATKKKSLKENFASKVVASTAPKKENILEEGQTLAARFKELAKIKTKPNPTQGK